MSDDGATAGMGPLSVVLPGMLSPWEMRELYIQNSPVFYLDRVKTPLLIVHGTADPIVAPFLADEVFVGLRSLGKEVVYLKYRNEGHSIEAFANQMDYCVRMIQWFDNHLKTPTISGELKQL